MVGDAGLELHARFEVRVSIWSWTTRFGTGAPDAYLLNRLYRSTPAWKMGPDLVYIELVPGQKTVRLFKKLADLRRGERHVAVAPFVTRSGRRNVAKPCASRSPSANTSSTRCEVPAGRRAQTAVSRTSASRSVTTGRVEGAREETRQIQGTESSCRSARATSVPTSHSGERSRSARRAGRLRRRARAPVMRGGRR